MIIEVGVFLGDRVERVPVELQIRTIAMDSWASLEHKIYTTYERAVPPRLLNELTDAAEAAHRLDTKMQRLHNDVAAPTAGHDTHDVDLNLAPPSTIDDWRPGTGRHP
jgi:putative GTP pyrophosphokinase